MWKKKKNKGKKNEPVLRVRAQILQIHLHILKLFRSRPWAQFSYLCPGRAGGVRRGGGAIYEKR